MCFISSPLLSANPDHRFVQTLPLRGKAPWLATWNWTTSDVDLSNSYFLLRPDFSYTVFSIPPRNNKNDNTGPKVPVLNSKLGLD